VLAIGLGLGAFTWNREAVFFEGSVYFADGDCYARMTRVRMLQEQPFSPVREHVFENYPVGTRPHTTSPLDYLILGLSWVLKPLGGDSLSLAGAWVSPFLGVATLVFFAIWSWRKRWAFRAGMLVLVAVSPILSHGFLLGRPDHQSLLLFLLAVALALEVEIWRGGRGGWMEGLVWGVALWVSLFEPLILLTALLLMRLVAGRLVVRKVPVAVFAGVLLLGWLVDGIHVAAFDANFGRWARNIGELRQGSLPVLLGWVGWLAVVGPVLLTVGFFRKREPVFLFFLVAVLVSGGLTFWHLRWGYFFALITALAIPWGLSVVRWRSVGWGIFVVSLWPVAAEWERTLYPDDEAFRARAEAVVDAVALRDAALRLKGLPERGVLAPWWFSPAIVWWSGQPCVAGTSHQSLPGIADASEFFLSEGDGREILAKRKAGYLVAYDPDRVVSNAAQILGRKEPADPLARRLYNRPRAQEWRLLYANRFFKVFEGNPPTREAGEIR